MHNTHIARACTRQPVAWQLSLCGLTKHCIASTPAKHADDATCKKILINVRVNTDHYTICQLYVHTASTQQQLAPFDQHFRHSPSHCTHLILDYSAKQVVYVYISYVEAPAQLSLRNHATSLRGPEPSTKNAPPVGTHSA